MLLAILAAILGAEVRHCIYYENDSFTLVPLEGKGHDCVATTISDIEALNETGWMRFNITTSANYPDFIQMRSVGFAEGKLFQHHIFNHYHNMKDWFLFAYLNGADEYPQEVYDYLSENLEWTRTNAYKYAEVDSFWRHVAYTLDHFDGLVEAYRANAPQEEMLSELDLWTYMSSGDLLDIVNFAVPSTRADFSKMTREEISDYLAVRSHCSGLVYYQDEDIYIGHTSWFFYGGMTRVFKGYTLNLNDVSNAADTITFSSYPGFSYSFDDWIITSQGLVIFETTANVLNTTLYDNCTPKSVLAWIRSQVASRISMSASTWHENNGQYNSGTYNNQWVVVDLKWLEGITAYRNHLVWVSEQMPGYILADDMAYDLAYGGHYFASYNTPFFDELWIVAGYPSVAEEDPSYRRDKNPRALMFARDVPSITSVDDMKRIMRYNKWQTDPLAITEGQTEPDAGNGISARYDLRTDESRRKAFGGYDAKVLTYNSYNRKMIVYFISGPTSDDQEPWDFSKSSLYCPHRGLKDGPYQYEWQEHHLPVYWHGYM